MINESTHRIRIAKIHAQLDARIYQHVVFVIRHVNGIPEKWLVHWLSKVIEQQEVQLMNMEGVQFVGPILDDPIFHGSLLRDNVRQARMRIEQSGFLTIYRDVKLSRAIRVVRIGQFL